MSFLLSSGLLARVPTVASGSPGSVEAGAPRAEWATHRASGTARWPVPDQLPFLSAFSSRLGRTGRLPTGASEMPAPLGREGPGL